MPHLANTFFKDRDWISFIYISGLRTLLRIPLMVRDYWRAILPLLGLRLREDSLGLSPTLGIPSGLWVLCLNFTSLMVNMGNEKVKSNRWVPLSFLSQLVHRSFTLSEHFYRTRQFLQHLLPFCSITPGGYHQWQWGYFITWSLSAMADDVHSFVGRNVQKKKRGPDGRRLVIHLR